MVCVATVHAADMAIDNVTPVHVAVGCSCGARMPNLVTARTKTVPSRLGRG
jgi:hypothetical protein